MFGWLRRLFRRDSTPTQSAFTYHNGTRTVPADAMQVVRGFMLHEAADYDFEQDCKLAGLPLDDPGLTDEDVRKKLARDVLMATGRLADATRAAFKVGQVADGGLDDEQCLRLLLAFMKWRTAEKKNGSTSPTSASPTPATWGGGRPPPSLLACGSTADADKPSEPQPSPAA